MIYAIETSGYGIAGGALEIGDDPGDGFPAERAGGNGRF